MTDAPAPSAEESVEQFDEVWKAILMDSDLRDLRRKCSLQDIRLVVMHASAPGYRQIQGLTARATAAEAQVREMREKANAVLENIGAANWYAGTPANQCQLLLAEATRALLAIATLAATKEGA